MNEFERMKANFLRYDGPVPERHKHGLDYRVSNARQAFRREVESARAFHRNAWEWRRNGDMAMFVQCKATAYFHIRRGKSRRDEWKRLKNLQSERDMANSILGPLVGAD